MVGLESFLLLLLFKGVDIEGYFDIFVLGVLHSDVAIILEGISVGSVCLDFA